MPAIRPALATLAVRVLCTCGERLWLSTTVSAHWEQGHFDTPDPCDGGHDWVTRVVPTDDRFPGGNWLPPLEHRELSRYYETHIIKERHVFCVRPGCVAKASDALVAVAP